MSNGILSSTFLRTWFAGLRALLVLTVVTGVAYPLVITVLGFAFPGQANGSLITAGGHVVGSSLIGQSFADDKGNALPQWFQSRPSAGNYDPMSSGGSNLGPENETLIKAIKDRQAAVATSDGVQPSSVPADALTASWSGLDPHISPAYALEQVSRVAKARGLSEATVRQLVLEHTQGRILGFLGEPRVNVVELNLALASAKA